MYLVHSEDGAVTDLLKDKGEKFHKESTQLFTQWIWNEMYFKTSV